jgi:thioredoxin reductase
MRRKLEAALQRVTYVIVGAGPAGLQLAHFLNRAGHEFVVLEAGETAGGFFDRFPRHRTLLSLNKRFNIFPEEDFNLRHDWNSLLSDVPGFKFGNYSDALYPDAADYVRYLRDFAETLSDRIQYEAQVVRVTAGPGGTFDVHLRSGAGYRCDRLIMATGAVAPYIPDDIDGIEHAVGYEDHSLDPAEYQGKTVGIIGSGNSAFEVANHLAGHAAMVHVLVRSRIRHAWETHFPGDLRSINNTILDMYQLKSMHATVGDRLESIVPNPNGGFDVAVAVDVPHWDPPGTFRVPRHYDKVIRCTGWRYLDLDLFAPECRPQADPTGRYPVLSSTWESTVPGLYFIGTAMQARGRAAATPFIHGFRYNIRCLFHLLQERYHHVSLPHRRFPAGTPEDLAALAIGIINRVSTAASIFQQFGVLADAVVFDGEEARLYTALPLDHLFEHTAFTDATMVVVTLEYGFSKYPRTLSTLDFLTPKDPRHTECGAFLHPVFRLYRQAELVTELHFNESLLIRYDLGGQITADDPQAGRLAALLAMAQGSTEPLPDPPLYLPVQDFTFTPWTEQERRAWRPAVTTVPEPDAECHFER